ISDFGEEAPSEIRNPKSAIAMAQQLLAAGHIVAIKGLGGFHLACDATNETAVAELRRRKLRREKPFALMMPDVATVMQHCFVSDAERDLLLDRARPIVLLRRRPDSPIAAACAPGQDRLGVMLPYTPLHYVLFASSESRGAGEQGSRGAGEQGSRGENGSPAPPPLCPPALVMTSGNLSEEPIAYTNDDARQRLAPLADAFLMHNRDIHVRCDDSVMRMVDFGFRTMPISDLGFRISDGASSPKSEIPNPTYLLPLRRSRGYAPFPVRLPWEAPPALGAGAELKNTFCLTNGRYAFLSHHIGDMENYETLLSFEAGVAHFERLFRVQPALIAYDLHPDYLATRYALARAARESIPAVGVQHHHAHIAAVMAENGHPGDRPVIGVSFDGTGYGTDGTIWGGEFLVADYGGFERPYHLAPVPLPGGDKAVREPWRIALAWLHQAGIDWAEDLAPVDFGFGMSDVGNANRSEIQHPTSDILNVLRHQITRGLNAPLTSSMGRLFDAVAALAGLRQTVSYEAQAAMELEALADPAETAVYPFTINHLPLTINNSQFSIVNSQFSIDPSPLLAAIVADIRAGISVPIISARFHNGVAQMVLDVCRALRRDTGLSEVALSGGVWQNVTLLARTAALLRAAGFTLLLHTRVPPNDGGLALGQTIIGAMKSK
ncbi:MAG: carbamoyltransferase HypF, partial [Anaerolineales bacterium]|nr:carbamoyltransferase HypF [Anaerolineales bacterium]